jgi:hypothetical protein
MDPDRVLSLLLLNILLHFDDYEAAQQELLDDSGERDYVRGILLKDLWPYQCFEHPEDVPYDTRRFRNVDLP